MTDRPNVMHVTVDSLRADHCGFLGGMELTPSLDAIATDGVVYEQAYAPAGSTRAAAASFLTGRYPHARPTADTTLETTRQHYRAADSLPERLSRLGYETAVFTANPHVSRYYIDEDTFDRFEDRLETTANQGTTGTGIQTTTLSRLLNWWRGQEMFMTWESLYDDILKWIDSASAPYYCWVFLVDPHMPYLPPAGYRSRSQVTNYLANAALFADRPDLVGGVLREAYRDSVRYTDEFFDRLDGDLAEDTAMVVHADHGEVFGEHGAYGHGGVDEEILHVPLVVSAGPTGRVDEPVSLKALPAMIEDIARDRFNPHSYGQPWIRARLQGPERVIRGRNWKYVQLADGDQVYHAPTSEDLIPVDAQELLRGCRLLVESWNETNAERRAVMAATAGLADEGRV